MLIFLFCQLILAPSLLFANSPENEPSHIDRLFDQLKNAKNETEAQLIEQNIWKAWTTPKEASLANKIKQALSARQSYDYDGALAILNQVVLRWPHYAEGWNQRATVYFLKGDYQKSLKDIAETLKREPRHFGSLAGRAVIRLRQGKAALGYQSIVEAMKHHPFLRERAFFPQFQK